jgi:acetyl esterase/lipase
MRKPLLCLFGLLLVGSGVVRADDAPAVKRTRDVIYGRKYGLALTLDVFAPKKVNGLGVIAVVSGGWFSRPQMIAPPFYQELLRRGYTVFAVLHGSQPKFTLPEIAEDMHRAVRYIRYHAKSYKIDPDRIGITGMSAGGHLSLLMGTAGAKGNPKAPDPIDRDSSAVQAVGAFFPPTDFLNWGRKGNELIDRAFQPPFTAAADYHEFDSKRALFIPIKDKKKLREISRAVSPITYVAKTSAAALLIHGDKDTLVPLQQSEIFAEKMTDAGATAKLVVRKGERHGWLTILDDMKLVADWFDEHLAKKPKKAD